MKRSLVALVLSLFLALPASAAPRSLVILHTNDTHDRLIPYDTPQQQDVGGIARRAALISEIKRQAPLSLVLDAGDTFQGTPLYHFFKGQADYEAMDLAGYDATTVGNHDLDDGLSNLLQQHQGRRFKLICTNLVDRATNRPLFTPTHVFEVAGLRVGVFGLLGKAAVETLGPENQRAFKWIAPEALAQATADDLRRCSDVVVLLSHSGYEQDLELARHLSGVDVIIGGHSHTKVDRPTEVRNGDWRTLVVQAYQGGAWLGRLDLQVEGGRVVAHEGRLLPIGPGMPEAPAVKARVDRYQQQIAERMGEVLGTAPGGLSSAGKYQHDTELGNWTADLIRARGNAEIGIINAGSLRSSLPSGPVTVGTVYTLFPFDNSLVTLEMSGELIQRLLDKAAADPGQQGLLQYSGLTCDMSDGRAGQVLVNGQPIQPSRTYRVATIDYVAQGNGKYGLFSEARSMEPLNVLLREAAIAHLRAQGSAIPPDTGRIRTVPSR